MFHLFRIRSFDNKMMNAVDNDDDDDDDEIIFDRRVTNPTSASGSMLLGSNQFNIRISNDVNKLSKEKTILLTVTFISIGMLNGVFGVTFPFLSQNISFIIWFISIKSIGFLIGIYLSSYFFTWFNTFCLLSLSCLSISLSLCSFPFIINFTIFNFISLILGFGLGLIYNGIDILYNRVWNRSSISSIRWLHLLIPLGAILSILLLLLFSSTISNDNNILLSTNITRPRRAIFNDSIITTSSLETQTDDSKDLINTTTTTVSLTTSQTITTNSPSSITISKMTSQITIANSTLISSTYPMIVSTNDDDVSKNYSSHKIDQIFHSITSIHYIYLFLALLFFLLSIFYLKLAIYGERIRSSSIKNLNPLSLIIIKPQRIFINPNTQISIFSDRLSLTLIILILFYYFILSGIENSCNYLTYSFGRKFEYSKIESLLLQFCYLFGRFISISINFIWLFLNIKTDIISIKSSIIIRLSILFILYFLNLFQHIFYFLFFSIGFLLGSLSNLILYWIEQYFNLNEKFLHLILFIIIISETIFPLILFYQIQYFIQIYFLIFLCLLIILFLMILYFNQKWQDDRIYRLLSTSIEMELTDNSDDNDNSKFH